MALSALGGVFDNPITSNRSDEEPGYIGLFTAGIDATTDKATCTDPLVCKAEGSAGAVAHEVVDSEIQVLVDTFESRFGRYARHHMFPLFVANPLDPSLNDTQTFILDTVAELFVFTPTLARTLKLKSAGKCPAFPADDSLASPIFAAALSLFCLFAGNTSVTRRW